MLRQHWFVWRIKGTRGPPSAINLSGSDHQLSFSGASLSGRAISAQHLYKPVVSKPLRLPQQSLFPCLLGGFSGIRAALRQLSSLLRCPHLVLALSREISCLISKLQPWSLDRLPKLRRQFNRFRGSGAMCVVSRMWSQMSRA
jgi:hypothetical protein